MIAIPAAAAIPAAMIKIVADEIAAAVERGKRIGMNAPDHTSSRQPIHIAAGERSLASKVASANTPVAHSHTHAPVAHSHASVTHTHPPVTHTHAPVTNSPINSAAAIKATTATIKSALTSAVESPGASAIESTPATHVASTATHLASAAAAIAPKVAATATATAAPAMTTTPSVGRAVAWSDRTGQQQHRRQGDPANACRPTHPSDRGLPHLQAGVPGNTFKAGGHHLYSTGNISVGIEHLRRAAPVQRNEPPV